MILRAAIPGGENSLDRSRASILVFLALALSLHFVFFMAWDKTEAARPFEIEPISMEALGIPLELVLELGSLPPLEEAEGPPADLSQEPQALPPEMAPPLASPSDAPGDAPAGEAPPAVPEDPAARMESPPPSPPRPEELSFPLSRSAALLGEALNPQTFPNTGPPGVDNTINVEESAPSAKSYDITIRTAVARLWILPPEARNNFRPARFTASMTLDPAGQIILIMVEESSGNSVLDHAAMEALRGAAPYEPFPENLAHLDRMTFRIHFDYKAVIKSGLPGN